LDISFYIINIILFIFIVFLILLFILNLFGTTIYCDGDLDKFLEITKEVKDAANNVNSMFLVIM
jgi:energy-converting hydrogenase Eha subunit H